MKLIPIAFSRELGERLLTEIGCWGICAVYSVLAGIWWKFYLMSS